MNIAIRRYLPEATIKELQDKWIAAFKLLEARLDQLMEQDAEKIEKHVYNERRIPDSQHISELYQKIKDRAPSIETLDEEQLSCLASTFQNFLFLHLYCGSGSNSRRALSKQKDTFFMFCMNTLQALEKHQIEGALYNALIAHAHLYPINNIDDETQKLLSIRNKTPLDSIQIVLARRIYESIPLLTYNFSDGYRCTYIDTPLGDALPQDRLRTLWHLDSEGYLPRPFQNDFLIYTDICFGRLLLKEEEPAHSSSYFVHSEPNKPGDDQDIYFYRNQSPYFLRKYLSFYIQLIEKAYSLNTIILISDFLLSNAYAVRKENGIILKKYTNNYNYDIATDFYCSFEQLHEIYALARETKYPLDSNNALTLAQYLDPCKLFSPIKLISKEKATIKFSEKPLFTPESSQNTQTETYLTQNNVANQQKSNQAQLDKDLKNTKKLLTQNSDHFLYKAIDKYLIEKKLQNTFPLYNALKKKIQNLNDEDSSANTDLQGVLYNALITLNLCHPKNTVKQEHANSVTKTLLAPDNGKPIPQEKAIMFAEGYYFNKDAFSKKLTLSPQTQTTSAEKLQFKALKLKGYDAFQYLSISFDSGILETYFPWRDIVRLLSEIKETPTLPIALYPHIPPIEEDFEDKSNEAMHGFILSEDDCKKWETTLKDSRHTCLVYEKLTEYVEAIKTNQSLKNIVSGKSLKIPLTSAPLFEDTTTEKALPPQEELPVAITPTEEPNFKLREPAEFTPLLQKLKTLEKYFKRPIDNKATQEALKNLQSITQKISLEIEKIQQNTQQESSDDQRIKDQEDLKTTVAALRAIYLDCINSGIDFSLPYNASVPLAEDALLKKDISLEKTLYDICILSSQLYPINTYSTKEKQYFDYFSKTKPVDKSISLLDGYLYDLDILKRQFLSPAHTRAFNEFDYIDLKSIFSTERSEELFLPSYAIFEMLYALKEYRKSGFFEKPVLWEISEGFCKRDTKTTTQSIIIGPASLKDTLARAIQPNNNVHLLLYERLSLYIHLTYRGLNTKAIIAKNRELDQALLEIQKKQTSNPDTQINFNKAEASKNAREDTTSKPSKKKPDTSQHQEQEINAANALGKDIESIHSLGEKPQDQDCKLKKNKGAAPNIIAQTIKTHPSLSPLNKPLPVDTDDVDINDTATTVSDIASDATSQADKETCIANLLEQDVRTTDSIPDALIEAKPKPATSTYKTDSQAKGKEPMRATPVSATSSLQPSILPAPSSSKNAPFSSQKIEKITQENKIEYEKKLRSLLKNTEGNAISEFLKTRNWNNLDSLISHVGAENITYALANIETLYQKQEKLSLWLSELQTAEQESRTLSSRKTFLKKLKKKHSISTIIDLSSTCTRNPPSSLQDYARLSSAAIHTLGSEGTCEKILNKKLEWPSAVKHQMDEATSSHHDSKAHKEPHKVQEPSSSSLSAFFHKSSHRNTNKHSTAKKVHHNKHSASNGKRHGP